MIIVDPKAPKPMFWHENFLKDFESSHPNQRISTVIWSKDSSSIIRQIKFAIDHSVERILSEILPDELPDSLLLEEYLFFEKSFLYVPPHLPFEMGSPSIGQAGKKVIFRDTETISSSSRIITEALKDRNVSIVNVEDIDSSMVKSETTQLIEDSEIVFLDTKANSPQLLSLICILTLRLGKVLVVDSPESLSLARLGVLGLCIRERKRKSFFSLRKRISEIFKTKESNVEILCADTFEIVSNNYSGDEIERIFKDTSYKKFSQEIYSQEIPEGIWIRPLIRKENSSFRIVFSRFKIKYFFSTFRLLKDDSDKNRFLDEFFEFLTELLCLPMNESLKDRLIAVAQFDPLIFVFFEGIILEIYKNLEKKEPLMCKIAELMLIIASADSDEDKYEIFGTLAIQFVNKDLELGKIDSFSHYSKFPEILSLDISEQRNSCVSILRKTNNQKNHQNSFTGTLSLATILLSIEDIENEILNFDLTQNQQDVFILNLIYRYCLSYNEVSWGSQKDFETKFISTKNFIQKLYLSNKFNSFYLKKIVSRLDPDFYNFFQNIRYFSIYDLLLLIDFSIANGVHSVNLPEQFLDSGTFTYEDLLLIIIKLANEKDCHNELESFKKHFDSLSKVQSFIKHPNQLSVIRLLLALIDSSFLEEISRLDESLNPNGPKPYEFYIQNLT